MSNFNLSKEIHKWKYGFISTSKVKEFIKRLKATMLITPSPTTRGDFILWLGKEIDKLAGEALLENSEVKGCGKICYEGFKEQYVCGKDGKLCFDCEISEPSDKKNSAYNYDEEYRSRKYIEVKNE